MKRQHPARALTILVTTLVASVVLLGCATKRGEADLDIADMEELKEVLNASEFRSCNIVENRVKLPVPVRTASVITADGKTTVVYEGLFRESVKTVWQPLSKGYQIEEDGVVVGNRNSPHVVDFTTQYDTERGFWATFRSKIANSERFFATVEYLPHDSKGVKVARVVLPLSGDETTQRIWVIPLPQISSPTTNRDKQAGMAHVFVKTVSTTGNISEASEGQITWFLVHGPKGAVKKMGEYRDRPGSSFLPERFLLTTNADDPTAVGLSFETSDYDESQSAGGAGRHQSRIIAMRPFLPNTPQTVLHQERTNLSTLAVSSEDGSTSSMVLAWLKNSEDASPPSIFYAYHRLAVGEMRPPGAEQTPVAPPAPEKPTLPTKQVKGKKAKKRALQPLKPIPAVAHSNAASKLAIREIKTGYIPARLQFEPTAFGSNSNNSMMLTWIGGTDTHLALISAFLPETIKSLPAGNAPSDGGTRTVALTSGDSLGRLLSATISPDAKGNVFLTYLESGKSNTPQPATLRLCVTKRADLGK
jgi:hypothetical protein